MARLCQVIWASTSGEDAKLIRELELKRRAKDDHPLFSGCDLGGLVLAYKPYTNDNQTSSSRRFCNILRMDLATFFFPSMS